MTKINNGPTTLNSSHNAALITRFEGFYQDDNMVVVDFLLATTLLLRN